MQPNSSFIIVCVCVRCYIYVTHKHVDYFVGSWVTQLEEDDLTLILKMSQQ